MKCPTKARWKAIPLKPETQLVDLYEKEQMGVQCDSFPESYNAFSTGEETEDKNRRVVFMFMKARPK